MQTTPTKFLCFLPSLALLAGGCDLDAWGRGPADDRTGPGRPATDDADTDGEDSGEAGPSLDDEDDGETGTTGAGPDQGGAPTAHTEDCTRTRGYWQTHHAEGNAKSIPWPIPEDTELCGSTWIEVLWTSPSGDALYILGAQWIAATLNVEMGAEPSPAVAAALAEGETILQSCAVDAATRPHAIELAGILDSFNNGLEGAEHCDHGGDDGDDGATSTDTGADSADDAGETDGNADSGGTDSGEGESGSAESDDTECVVDPEGVFQCDGEPFPPVG